MDQNKFQKHWKQFFLKKNKLNGESRALGYPARARPQEVFPERKDGTAGRGRPEEPAPKCNSRTGRNAQMAAKELHHWQGMSCGSAVSGIQLVAWSLADSFCVRRLADLECGLSCG